MLIGTRGSKLALTQTNIVVEKLKRFCREEIELKIIKKSIDICYENSVENCKGIKE